MVKPCDLRRSLLFREIAILAVPRSPCLQNIILMTVQASSVPPRRPWPSRRRYCPGPRRAAIISGPTGGRRCPRYGALLKRGLGVRSSWPRSGSFNGLPRPDVARELPFKRPIIWTTLRGEARCTTRLWVFGSLASDWLLALPLQRPHIRLSTVQRNAYSMPCRANHFEPIGMASDLLGEVLPILPSDPS